MAVRAVSEKDVIRREGEGEKEKRRMTLEQHVGWSKKQWRTALETTPSNCFGIRPVTPPPRWVLGSQMTRACFDMPDDLETHESTPTLYFGYGSNMWIDQMNRRCPENKYIGTAVLHDWWAGPDICIDLSPHSSTASR